MASGTIKTIANKPSLKSAVGISLPYTPVKNGVVRVRFTHAATGSSILSQVNGCASSTYNAAGMPSELSIVVGKDIGSVNITNASGISIATFMEFE